MACCLNELTVARKIGHARHLRRIARTQLIFKGLAATAAPDGRDKWFIARAYDPRLAAGGIGERNAEPDLQQFSEKQRRGALARRACVERFNQALATRPGKVADWLGGFLAELARDFPDARPSRSRLYAWKKLFQRPADTVKLIDTRGCGPKGRGDVAAWKTFADLFLHENQPSIRQTWRAVKDIAERNGWAWCSLKSCHAQLDSRIPPQTQLMHRDPARYRQTQQPYIEQDPEAWKAGECWVGDHHQLNIWCRHGGKLIRPWLTAWQCPRTRRIVGWVLSDSPNSSTILAALRAGLLDERNMGGPAVVWIDNGKDYDCWAFHGQTKKERLSRIKPAVDESAARGIFNLLRIEPHFSLAYNPNGKARIERWFGTLEGFYRTFETYAGNSPETRPERLEYVLSKPGLIPSFEDVKSRLQSHIEGDNASADHGIDDLAEDGVRISPDEAMRRWCQSRRVMADPKALDLLLQMWHKPVTVGRNGISLAIAGRVVRYGQFEPALQPYKGLHKEDRRPVNVAYDPADLRIVRVYDEKLRFICACSMNQTGGNHSADPIAREHIAELSRQRAAYNKAQKHQAEFGITSVLTNEENLAEIAASAASKPTAAPAAGLKIVATELDGQSRAVAAAELRKAVGDGTPTPVYASILDKLNASRQAEPAQNASLARTDVADEWGSDPWAKFRGKP